MIEIYQASFLMDGIGLVWCSIGMNGDGICQDR